MKKKTRLAALGVALCMMLTSLTGCGGSADAQSSSTSGSDGRTTASVGIGNAFSPFCYLNEDEELAGYDYEVMLAVAELLSDEYEFVFTADDFSNLLIGLDTGAYDIAVHHYGYTTERAENYLYANEADFYTGLFHIGYVAGRTDITDFDSLDGKTVVTSSGSMAETLILNYLADHPDLNVTIEYSSDKEVWYSGLVNGRYDALIASSYDLDVLSEQYDNFLEYGDYVVPSDDATDVGTYFIYSKGDEALRDAIDQALVTLRENGTLSELCIELLGADYTEPVS